MAKLGIEAHLYVHVYVTLTTPTNNDIQLTFDVYTQLTGTSNMKKSNQNNQNNRHHHPAPSSTPSSPYWLVNQRCLALWKDGYIYPAKIIYTTKKRAYVEFEADNVFHKVGYDSLESLSSSECDSSSQDDTSKKKKSRKNKYNNRNQRKTVKRVRNQKTRTDNSDEHRDGSGSGIVDDGHTAAVENRSKTPSEDENEPRYEQHNGEDEVVGRKTKGRKQRGQRRQEEAFRHTHNESKRTKETGSGVSKAHRAGADGVDGTENTRELYFGDDLDTAKDIQTGLRPDNEFRSLRAVTTGIHKRTIKSECQYNGCPSYRLRFTVEPTGTSRAIGFACALFVVLC